VKPFEDEDLIRENFKREQETEIFGDREANLFGIKKKNEDLQ